MGLLWFCANTKLHQHMGIYTYPKWNTLLYVDYYCNNRLSHRTSGGSCVFVAFYFGLHDPEKCSCIVEVVILIMAVVASRWRVFTVRLLGCLVHLHCVVLVFYYNVLTVYITSMQCIMIFIILSVVLWIQGDFPKKKLPVGRARSLLECGDEARF